MSPNVLGLGLPLELGLTESESAIGLGLGLNAVRNGSVNSIKTATLQASDREAVRIEIAYLRSRFEIAG